MDDLQYPDVNTCFKFHKAIYSFKPCYKWMTFNTYIYTSEGIYKVVLNLVINGWPSIQ